MIDNKITTPSVRFSYLSYRRTGLPVLGIRASDSLCPTGRRDETDFDMGYDETDFDMGYSQSEFFFDLCVNVLVRPTRISPRQSGAAGPRSTLRGCTARPGSSVTYCNEQRRPGRVPRFIGVYHHRRTPCLCAWV